VEDDGELAPGEVGRGGVRPSASDRCDSGILCGERERVRVAAALEKNWRGGTYLWGWR
jgi:hypothetical protein